MRSNTRNESAARLLIYYPFIRRILSHIFVFVISISLTLAESHVGADQPLESDLGDEPEKIFPEFLDKDFDDLIEPILPTDKIRNAMELEKIELSFMLQDKLLEEIGYEIESSNFGNISELYQLRVEFPILGDPVSLLMPFDRFNFAKLSEEESAMVAFMYFNENMPQMGQKVFSTHVSRNFIPEFTRLVEETVTVLDSQGVVAKRRLEEKNIEWLGRLLIYPALNGSNFPLAKISHGVKSATDPLKHHAKIDDFFIASMEESGTELQTRAFEGQDFYTYDLAEFFNSTDFFEVSSPGTDKASIEFSNRYNSGLLKCANFSNPQFWFKYEPVSELYSRTYKTTVGTQADFIFSTQDENLAFLVLRNDDIGQYTCLNISGSSAEFVDLNADGDAETIIYLTLGSSSLLDVLIISSSFEQFWMLPQANHGSLELIDLDGDSSEEILLRGWNTFKRFDTCNQCPARIHLDLFELGKDDVLRHKSEIMGAAEVLTGANLNLFGLSESMNYFTEKRPAHSALLENFLSNFSEGDISVSARLFDDFLDQVERLQRIGRLTDALDALNIVHKNGLVQQAFPSRWLHSSVMLSQLYLSTGNFEKLGATARKAILATEDPAMPRDIASDAGPNFQNFDLIASVILGDFEHAEQIASRTEVKEMSPAIANNVAILYNRLAAWEKAAEQTTIALIKSFEAGEFLRISSNSTIYAEALYEMNREEEALNWLFRAISTGREVSKGGALFEQLMLAAEFAIDFEEKTLARAFLAEALTQVSEIQWNISAARFYTLLSRTASSDYAKFEYLRLAIEHSRDRNRRDFASAKYFEGTENIRLGRKELAIENFFEAFRAVQRRRIDIGSSSFKLSHLVDSKIIYDILSKTLYDSGRLEMLFDTSDDWKLQAFFDELSARDQITEQESGFNKAIRTSIDADATIVAYVEIENKILAYVFEQGDYKVVELESEKDKVQMLVDEISEMFDVSNDASRSKIVQDRISSDDLKNLRDAYNKLVLPLEVSSEKTLYIVPSDSLVSLPWAALAPPPNLAGRVSELLLGKSGYYPMAEMFAIAILPSVALIRKYPERRNKMALVVHSSGPFDEPYELSEIPDTQNEADLVSRAYLSANGTAHLLGPMDDSGSFAEIIDDLEPSVIHFAAHAVFDDQKPLDSFLMLGEQSNPYPLGALEISRWDSRSLSLVTLAACQSGAQTTEVGGEFFGLTRAFFLAGAETIVASPWLVPDKSTKEFFVKFHSEIAAGADAELALQAAQRAVRKEFSHPFYWASFYMTTLAI